MLISNSGSEVVFILSLLFSIINCDISELELKSSSVADILIIFSFEMGVFSNRVSLFSWFNDSSILKLLMLLSKYSEVGLNSKLLTVAVLFIVLSSLFSI